LSYFAQFCNFIISDSSFSQVFWPISNFGNFSLKVSKIYIKSIWQLPTIHKLQRKESAMNLASGTVFTVFYS